MSMIMTKRSLSPPVPDEELANLDIRWMCLGDGNGIGPNTDEIKSDAVFPFLIPPVSYCEQEKFIAPWGLLGGILHEVAWLRDDEPPAPNFHETRVRMADLLDRLRQDFGYISLWEMLFNFCEDLVERSHSRITLRVVAGARILSPETNRFHSDYLKVASTLWKEAPGSFDIMDWGKITAAANRIDLALTPEDEALASSMRELALEESKRRSAKMRDEAKDVPDTDPFESLDDF